MRLSLKDRETILKGVVLLANEYLAKPITPDGEREYLKAHLEKVSDLAGEYARPLRMEEMARLCGILHDFGEYSTLSQKLMGGEATRVDHAGHGAAFLDAICKDPRVRPCIEAINGHHGGLVNYAAIGALGKIRAGKPGEQVYNFDKRCSVPNECEQGETLRTLMERFLEDFPNFKRDYFSADLEPIFEKGDSPDTRMLLTRLLYSCLIDAEYSASASAFDDEYFARIAGETLNAAAVEPKVDGYWKRVKCCAAEEQLYKDCSEAGRSDDWMMTVSAPAGAGRPVAVLKMALRKCRRFGKTKVIMVEQSEEAVHQTACVYGNMISDVLMDIGTRRYDDSDSWDIVSRWDAPCIVTTSKNFFESLFANDGPTCRKLHRIADSVVIINEPQFIPEQLLIPTMKALQTLAEKQYSPIILVSSAPPALDCLDASWIPVEAITDVNKLQTGMKRTEVEWRLTQKTSLGRIPKETESAKQCCVITNLDDSAISIAKGWNDPNFYVLTHFQCPAHRRLISGEVKEMLRTGGRCKASIVSPMERGLELSFPLVYRELAPLPDLIAAQELVNRDGKCHSSKFVVFEQLADMDTNMKLLPVYPYWYPSGAFQNGAMLAKGVLMNIGFDSGIDMNDSDVVREYYQRLYGFHEDDRELLRAISIQDYGSVSKEYRFPVVDGFDIIVPFDEDKHIYENILKSVKFKDFESLRRWMKIASDITIHVAINETDLHHICDPLMILGARSRMVFLSGKYILKEEFKNLYSDKFGLSVSN